MSKFYDKKIKKYFFNYIKSIKNNRKYENRFFKYYYNTKKLTDSKHGGGLLRKILITYYSFRISLIQRQCNCYIPVKSNIKEQPIFPHSLYGIFISSGCTIGKNCVIFHQVTIGSNTLPDSKHKGSPTIGDNVYIGAGAKIIGNVKIGNNVRIGANATVTKNIPDNATVVNGEIRIFFSEEKKDNKFIPYA